MNTLLPQCRTILTLKKGAELGLPGNNWMCGMGRCSRKAEFILLKPTVKKGEIDVEAIGLCERCGLTYARRNACPLPQEVVAQ